MNTLYLCCCFHTLVLLLSMIFKVVSEAVWNVPTNSHDLALRGAHNTDEGHVQLHSFSII